MIDIGKEIEKEEVGFFIHAFRFLAKEWKNRHDILVQLRRKYYIGNILDM